MAQERSSLRSLRLPAALGTLLALVTTLPYLAAFWHTPSGKHFLGFFLIADDATSYNSIMRQGMEGAWAWSNRYTTEFNDTSSIFISWLA